jgi:hypothetical protein
MNETTQPAVAGPVEPTVRPLLERLQEAGDDYTVAWGSGELYDEAAAEMERLHAENARLTN